MSPFSVLHELYESMSYPKVPLDESAHNIPGRHILNCAMGWVIDTNGPRMYRTSVEHVFGEDE